MGNRTRQVLLVVDVLGLGGLLIFAILGALHPSTRAYIFGQIICALLVLGCALLLRRLRNHTPPS